MTKKIVSSDMLKVKSIKTKVSQ